jgi:hypothetical protein
MNFQSKHFYSEDAGEKVIFSYFVVRYERLQHRRCMNLTLLVHGDVE